MNTDGDRGRDAEERGVYAAEAWMGERALGWPEVWLQADVSAA
jgi:hypothetical protein